MPSSAQEKLYTIDDIYALPDGERAELIDGQIYYMAPPSRKHQRISREIYATIRDYIKSNSGPCEVDIAPFAVFLNKDDTEMDYFTKLFKYRTSGVREYWICNPAALCPQSPEIDTKHITM